MIVQCPSKKHIWFWYIIYSWYLIFNLSLIFPLNVLFSIWISKLSWDFKPDKYNRTLAGNVTRIISILIAIDMASFILSAYWKIMGCHIKLQINNLGNLVFHISHQVCNWQKLILLWYFPGEIILFFLKIDWNVSKFKT